MKEVTIDGGITKEYQQKILARKNINTVT